MDVYSVPDPVAQPVVCAIADTHLGLHEHSKDGHQERPLLLAEFLHWLSTLSAEGYSLPVWNGTEVAVRRLHPPNQLILLGDILELWEAEDQAISLSTSTLTPVLARLAARKIYVLGNHDNVLRGMSGLYPLGPGNLEVVEEAYPQDDEGPRPLQIGEHAYFFLHGHQFDPSFVHMGGLWRLVAPVRQAGAALGDYAWIFAIWWIAAVVLQVFSPSLVGWLLVGGLPLLWIPRFYMRVAWRFWHKMTGVRYDRDAALRGFRSWWAEFSRNPLVPERVGIVFGHTHSLDWLELGPGSPDRREMTQAEAELALSVERLGSKRPTLYNISSWLSVGGDRKTVVMATAFYADEAGPVFIGWDWRARRPFHIPFEFVGRRRPAGTNPGDAGKAVGEIARKLGWPDEMIEKWKRPERAVRQQRRTPG